MPGGFALIQQITQRELHALEIAQLLINLLESLAGHALYRSAVAPIFEIEERRHLIQRETQTLCPLDEPDPFNHRCRVSPEPIG